MFFNIIILLSFFVSSAHAYTEIVCHSENKNVKHKVEKNCHESNDSKEEGTKEKSCHKICCRLIVEKVQTYNSFTSRTLLFEKKTVLNNQPKTHHIPFLIFRPPISLV